MVKEQLIQFETEIGDSFNRGEIKAPIHLYSGNEDLMIELFKEIDIENLLDKDFHYKICKKVSSNDVSYSEIKEHTEYIINSDIISYITFFSFYGSFLYNKYLREDKSFNSFLYEGINKIMNYINSSPKLDNNYY